MHRRDFFKNSALLTAAAAAGAGVFTGGCSSESKNRSRATNITTFELDELSVSDLQRDMASGRFTSAGLVEMYRRRIREIDQNGPRLHAVMELNTDAPSIARELDRERKLKGPRGLLHGIPILIKDNIDTHDRMTTTAGSLALEGSTAPRDAFVVERLRSAGAVILGKTNLSEWANFRGSRSISGWSGRGGLTRNPYATDRSTSGSSAGSAAAVSANLCAIAIGTETDGSIVSPSAYCGVVGLKPTVGLVSRSGIIPISSSQDTSGPMARCVRDAAVLLGAMAGLDPHDPATTTSNGHVARDRNYAAALDARALRTARIGIARSNFKLSRLVDPVFEAAITAIRKEGAVLVDPLKLPARSDLGDAEYQVMLYEFKDGLNAYFKSLGPNAPVKSLAELIEFNDLHPERELAYFGQETLIEAEAKGPLSDQRYIDAKARCAKWSKELATVLESNRLDAFVAPTTGPAHALDLVVGDRGLAGSSSFAAVSGLPSITVPCGEISGLPVGLSFIAGAWQEERLLALAYGFEQATRARKTPRFLPTVELP